MSWGYVIVGGATLVAGAMSSSAANKQGKRAEKAEAAQLEFAQQQYDDWQAVYGSVEQNLSEYYNNLSPEYYEAVGVEAIEGEYTVLREELAQSLAQRGISQDSGLALALERDVGIEEAEAKATARRDAPRMAAEDQSRFLQIGKGINPSASLENALAQRSATSRNLAESYSQAAGQAYGESARLIGTGLSNYLASQNNKPADPDPNLE